MNLALSQGQGTWLSRIVDDLLACHARTWTGGVDDCSASLAQGTVRIE
jgi:hypothetical protein